MDKLDWWAYEQEARAAGYAAVCGCDEAGAGPLAGPVYAAAVILPPGADIPGLDDSKKLSEKRRETLYGVITAVAVAWSVARVEAAEIDATDILSARMKAMQTAIDALPVRPDIALIDGNRDRGKSAEITTPHRLIVGGDGKSASIAAASVLAKVSRDRYAVAELDRRYPQYGFAKHKGYGTKAHYAALDKYGPCPEHRKSYLKKWAARTRDDTGKVRARGDTGEARTRSDTVDARTPKARGDIGENIVARYLSEQGFAILSRQWRCQYGELDLIARSPSGVICFVEVKLRKRGAVVSGREAVDARKRERLRKTASCWLSGYDADAPTRFDVAEVRADPDGLFELDYLPDAFR